MCEHVWYSQTVVPSRCMIADWCIRCSSPRPEEPPVEISRHALERALDMALEADDIRPLLDRPAVVQKGGGPGYPDHQEIWAHGRIAAVVDPVANVVVTFLWRGVEYQRGTDSEPFRDQERRT